MQIECLVAIAFATASLAQSQEDNDVPDSFVLFEHFPEVVAISDSDNDTIFECMAGKRISFDKENKRVKFMWFFNDPTNN
uniref:Putative lipocalin-5 3 n=1 Tax=Amblyomma triste TaxID=251400 RepID=A0A023GCE0_AMBTT